MKNGRKKTHYTLGIDEVGRGPLAGPVAVGVVRTKLSRKEYTKLLVGIRDSKKATKLEREMWYKKALVWKKEKKIDWAVTFKSAQYIDMRGIVPAIRACMYEGIKKVGGTYDDEFLLDGGLRLVREYGNQKTIIRGDSKEPLIALAATIAKVLRDKRITLVGKKYPMYGFETHKGYGTKKHREAISQFGLSQIHRQTFCKNILMGKSE
ncbi:MAG: ribonuclease HII [Minisyncoccia bacterium]